jgi:4-alpha-glucanotransferase
VLLHPTSLPSRHGSGTLGSAARRFVTWLARARQSLWQVLPLTPADSLGCPYSSPSAFAGNPLLLSLEDLRDDGWLAPADPAFAVLEDAQRRDPYRVDYDLQTRHRLPAVRRAALEVLARGAPGLPEFLRVERSWLDEWADWSAALCPDDTTRDIERAVQYLFDVQWSRLRAHAREAGVRLVGDLPIFVSGGSADVAAHPDLFRADGVAGCPPDAFSPDGQLWGNPLYAWEAHRADGFAWWKARVRSLLRRVDLIRVDHFRGFAACWEIPRGASNAVGGRWVEAPGAELFAALRDDLGGSLPFIAEDLGVITPDVEELRDRLGLPGMRVLQFGFDGDPDHPYLPHNHIPHCVVYTGTHDNDTSAGWYASADDEIRDRFRRYVARDGSDPAGDLVRLALGSVADTCIVPMQDVLRLGGDCRMNVPGTVGDGNWTWRLSGEQLEDGPADALGDVTVLYGRGA